MAKTAKDLEQPTTVEIITLEPGVIARAEAKKFATDPAYERYARRLEKAGYTVIRPGRQAAVVKPGTKFEVRA